MNETRKIEISLFIIRISTAIFLGLWASLKFIRPEWAENIVKGSYKLKNLGLESLPVEAAYGMGVLQLAIVIAFAFGLWRFWTYGLMMAMSAVGVIGSIGALLPYFHPETGELLMGYARFPRNLMLTSIPTLGALIALFIMRDMDNLFSLSARKDR